MLKESDRRASGTESGVKGCVRFVASEIKEKNKKAVFPKKVTSIQEWTTKGKEKGLAVGGGKVTERYRWLLRLGFWRSLRRQNGTPQAGVEVAAPQSPPGDMIIRAPHQCRHGVL